MAAWRYASQDYRTFSDHLYENDKHYHQSDYDDFYDIGRKNSLSEEEERFNLFISIPFYWGDDIG
ncbi:outer membrane protein [Shigella sonnei]|nr:outer membrane protein [Shigella sonnei]